jgi:hypothetical protein
LPTSAISRGRSTSRLGQCAGDGGDGSRKTIAAAQGIHCPHRVAAVGRKGLHHPYGRRMDLRVRCRRAARAVAAKPVQRIVDSICNGSVEEVLVGMVDSNMISRSCARCSTGSTGPRRGENDVGKHCLIGAGVIRIAAGRVPSRPQYLTLCFKAMLSRWSNGPERRPCRRRLNLGVMAFLQR